MSYLFAFIFPPLTMFIGAPLFGIISLALMVISLGFAWPLMSVIALFVVNSLNTEKALKNSKREK